MAIDHHVSAATVRHHLERLRRHAAAVHQPHRPELQEQPALNQAPTPPQEPAR